MPGHLPHASGLYDPQWEHDACGVGFVADLSARPSHRTLQLGLRILENLSHRGACGCDPETGDGAGVLTHIPHQLLAADLAASGIALPEPGWYGVGMLFLPPAEEERHRCEQLLQRAVAAEGQRVLGWRTVPVDSSRIGALARASEPVIRQIYVGRSDSLADQAAFERKLYVIRRRVQNVVAGLGLTHEGFFNVCSLSSRTIVYKGLLMAHQLAAYFQDLRDPRLETALALVHQRFSTNTFPTWDLAHPFRYLAHNGEINTLRGNRNWMRARESQLVSTAFGEDTAKILPLINRAGSDSAALDNAVELLVLGGRSLPHAMMMLIPEAWGGDATMDPQRRAFYEYHACLMEAWDGPAAVAFTDGRLIGGMLDRNGLRPARYLVTADGLVVLASETGVLDIEPERVVEKGRLQPGKMFLVDLEQHRIVSDEEIKSQLCGAHPYARWLQENRITVDSLPEPHVISRQERRSLTARQKLFGYTQEDIRFILAPMAAGGEQPLGSMGVDSPLAVLSTRPQLLYNFFKQLFAQVTNPPIDPIREELVMHLVDYIGKEGSLLEETPGHARMLRLDSPVLGNRDLEKLRQVRLHDFRAVTLPMQFRAGDTSGLERGVEALCRAAARATAEGYSFLILSDRAVDPGCAPMPALLATSAVNHHLVREGTRTAVGIVVETGEAREVMHFALLLGYGASAVNPYLAFEVLDSLAREGWLPDGLTAGEAEKNYTKAVSKGLLKTFAKMGISTLQSYRGAQIFEAVGLSQDLVDRYFVGTPSRLGGVGLEELQEAALSRSDAAESCADDSQDSLSPGGRYQWRRDGEFHQYNPDSIAALQHATRTGRFADFQAFSRQANDAARSPATLRALLRFVPGTPVALDEVEPAAEIVKRFATGAMSLGSISREAHETIAIAMNRVGGRSNTGEGGEDPSRYNPVPGGENRRSAIKQVASARFGVTAHYLVNADEIQIKMAQGAKPGEGGELPGHKVEPYIAQIRHTSPGITLISPPPHHDIYSIEDLAQLIFDLKNVNPAARISVKLVAEAGVGTVAAGVAKAHADCIVISGHDGGTGASPLSSIQHAGVPWELGLAETQQTLVRNDLRGRVRLQTDGQLKTGRDVAIAALLGAEEFGFATAPLVTLGCVMMRVCHLGTCPVGIATQDPVLRERFAGKPEHLIRYFFFVAEELRQIMAELGFRTVDEMVGRCDRLEARQDVYPPSAARLDLTPILARPAADKNVPLRCVAAQEHGLAAALDWQLIRDCVPALERGERVALDLPICNRNRSVGAMLSGRIATRYGPDGLPEGAIRLCFTGSAGQSFGAFLTSGIEMQLEGDANDYLGKGLSGGLIAVRPPAGSRFDPAENVIAGNTLLYGATSGEVYLCGTVGERFCVRNSGATAVVEGAGDHCCEYMTGGVVLVLGRTGRNFAAGMSGGVAFVWDPKQELAARPLRNALVTAGPICDQAEETLVRSLLERHAALTGSSRARELIERNALEAGEFVRIGPACTLS